MSFKIFSLISLCLISFKANSDELNDYLDKMKKVVEKDTRCEFAVASVPKNDRADKIWWPKRVACIGYLVFNEGTIKETKGCTAFFLNVNNLSITPLMSFGYNTASDQTCDSKGFNTVMSDTLIKHFNNDTYTIDTVKLAFTTPYFAYNRPYEQILIHTNYSQRHLKEWLEKEVALEKQETLKQAIKQKEIDAKQKLITAEKEKAATKIEKDLAAKEEKLKKVEEKKKKKLEDLYE